MSGSPAGRQRDEQVAEGRQQHRRDRDRPDPPARVERVATTAPMNDDAPPTAGDDADERRARARARRARTGSTRRPEHAPQRRQQHLGDREGPSDRVVPDEPEPVRGSRRAPARVLDAWAAAPPPADASASSTADTTNVTASMRIVIGRSGAWTRKPLMPNAGELGDRAAGRQGAVRLDEPLALDDVGR